MRDVVAARAKAAMNATRSPPGRQLGTPDIAWRPHAWDARWITDVCRALMPCPRARKQDMAVVR